MWKSGWVLVLSLSLFLGRGGWADGEKEEAALQGYDPVAYFEQGRALTGYPQWTAPWKGETYYFLSAAHRDQFLKNPERFQPVYGRWCAYSMARGEKMEADPRNFKVIDGKLYLFYSGFWGNPRGKWEQDQALLKVRADNYWRKITSEQARESVHRE